VCCTATDTTMSFMLSLHDALPISFDFRPAHGALCGLTLLGGAPLPCADPEPCAALSDQEMGGGPRHPWRHFLPRHFRCRDRNAEIGRATSELQSRENLVCRLLLEK